MDPTLAAFHLALLVIAGAVLVAAALGDARRFRIPNGLSLLLILMYPAFVYSAPVALPWPQSVAVFAVTGITGFCLFLLGLVGAGDVKLLAAVSLWAGTLYLAPLLLLTVIAGGFVSLAVLIRARLARRPVAKAPVPYGVAIAVGGCAVLGMMACPYFNPA